MTDQPRAIDLSIEVPGTPEQVWAAIATGPGITSWYVPHQVTGEPNGAATASFGPDPHLQVTGRVAAWEPPRRIVFDGGDGAGGLAFEWLVQAQDGASCVVRLVNTGFGSGDDWDAQFDGMLRGWQAFLANLRLHLSHFAGQPACPALPSVPWPAPADRAWVGLTAALGIEADLQPGDRFEPTAPGVPPLAGTVTDRLPVGLAILLEQPCPGTALVLAEGHGDGAGVSVWSYLYGPLREQLAAEQFDGWTAWLTSRSGGPR